MIAARHETALEADMFTETSLVVMLVTGSCATGAPGPATPAGPPEVRSAPLREGALLQLPFENIGGHIVIPVRINGSRPLRMVLDTGMSSPMVVLTRSSLGRELGFEGGTPVQVGGAGGGAPAEAEMFSGVQVSLGDIEQADQDLIVLDGPSSACLQDGVIGKSIFDRYAVAVDYEQSTITLYEATDALESAREVLPLTFDAGIPVVEATVELEDGTSVPVRLVVDFGARHALSLDVDGANGIEVPAETVGEVVGAGIRGDVEGRIGRIRALRLGAFEFRDVVTSFTRPETGTTCGAEGVMADGNLGSGILSRFDIAVDYRQARLLVSPNGSFEAPFEYNMAGFALIPAQDGALVVQHVVPGSPAAEAGIVAGDRITKVDRRSAKELAAGEIVDVFRHAGASVSVRVERDGKNFRRTLKLRRLI